ncbi:MULTISPECIES: MucR family transcriptional regulator [unclassified Aureimonas]|uniref:MucR family transcriptional regulator n=1 Tax=unclassified Aureimonas TaxID=2615206 RepID=UPI000721F8E8|nr:MULTISPECIES: MucR family transcriptional regulator [unclassified Aureimonas]ALN71214.1 hypothetical protein M673_00725 [Aureimonas sp. AU20]
MEDNSDQVSSQRYLAAQIVKAYVSNNHVPRDDLPSLISIVFDALKFDTPTEAAQAEAAPLVPAVSIKKSVTPDYIVCLEDGKQFKSLKRHLMTHYDLTPEAYRQKWGLPADYPMVAANYAAKRSELAKSIGLGRKIAAPEAVVEPTPAPEPEAAPAEEKSAKRRAPRKSKAAADTDA